MYFGHDCYLYENLPHVSVTHDEIRAFLGISLFSGYQSFPKERHYWPTQPDLGVTFVASAMTRTRFQALKSAMHIVDNSLPKGNKRGKTESTYTILNENLKRYSIFHMKLSVDESIMPYYGRHSAKMLTRDKPIRFGYKIWALCGSDDYPYKLKLYGGKEPYQTKLPLGTHVVNDMMSTTESCSAVTEHEVYFDNFFRSYALLKSLAEQNIKATGTVRDNRTADAANLMKPNAIMMKKMKSLIFAIMEKFLCVNGMTTLF
ncbi:piggyBac transposable element-derived protein 3-like [Macrobrachium rosenbergii]|uniref:piggyBac transposable element-derived protein 3-like n=1 Tax=Macrobrachium rosenbergii TaxID=79674 RepID=UPI0034D61A48